MSSLKGRIEDIETTPADVRRLHRQYMAETVERYGEIRDNPESSLAERTTAKLFVRWVTG